MMLDGELLLTLVEEHPNIDEYQAALLSLLMLQSSMDWLPFKEFEWKKNKGILVKMGFEIQSFKCVKLNQVKGAYIEGIENNKIKALQINELLETSWTWMDRRI